MKIIRNAIALLSGVVLAGCGMLGGQPEPWEPDPIIRGVSYIGVTVDDVDAAEAYYRDAVSAETLGDSVLEAGNTLAGLFADGDAAAQTRLVRRTNAQLRLMAFAERSPEGAATSAVPVQGPGIAHVCFQVARETNVYARILAAGANPIGHEELVQLNDENPVHYGYVRDPYGIITEIEEVDLAALNLPEPPRNEYRVRHVSLATPDLDRMIDFYSAFLGGQEPRHVGWLRAVSGDTVDMVSGLEGSEIEMAWFQLRNLEIEIFQYHSHPTERPAEPRPLDAPGYNMIVFDVSDVEAARQRLIDAGGEIVTEAGPLDGGEIIFGRDPDGNLIGLQTLSASSVFSAENFPDNGI
ncbi:glyoxalase/bleomycin resistance/dioxygenase family protein [Parasphingopyxis algicola]|uniref:VOC family protein n=1 Tax=Parasphingopyxis algicola TaxID=2026624 RepID=UPI0015A325A5|nr:VOC family protein [Parasphingopyxis algicola]QLC25209.1 glyoxalase/bleomycin resistance/dioxygenase family protein [Parasphingopyxis algicola]